MTRWILLLLFATAPALARKPKANTKPRKVPRSARVSHTHHHPRPRFHAYYRPPMLPSRELSDELAPIPVTTEETADPIVEPPPAAITAPAPAPIAAPTASAPEPWRLGGELSVLGRGATTNPDALGLRMHYGLRATALVTAFHERIVLRPGLAYYFRSSGSGYASVTEHLAELDLGVQYRVWRAARWQLLAGVAQAVSVGFSRIQAADVASLTAPVFGYRIGPSGAALFQLSPELALLTDVDLTLGVGSPVKPHYGVAFGVLISMPSN